MTRHKLRGQSERIEDQTFNLTTWII